MAQVEFLPLANNSLFFRKSVLSNLIQEIEPLDVSLIQKDVLPTTVDAMKRTISGLLPSDQFHVVIKALWLPLSKLLVSSMMTGYVYLHFMRACYLFLETPFGFQEDGRQGKIYFEILQLFINEIVVVGNQAYSHFVIPQSLYSWPPSF
ncbi:hypothetical protein AAG906_006025 [Vitis piasezkii]